MQLHRLQNISVTIQIKENFSVLSSGSECLYWAIQGEKSIMFSVMCVYKEKKYGQTDEQIERQTNGKVGELGKTDFLCFFSRSWLRLCSPSRWSLVSCSSAVNFWHFFFSCCTVRCTSSLSVCKSPSCSVHNPAHKHMQTNTLLLWQVAAYH